MSSTTSRLSLYKPADDGSEYVDVSTDLNANLDKLDAAIGFIPATTGSPPSSTFAGMGRQDTDTGRTFYRDGANSSWIQILSAGGTYNADLKMVQGKKVGIGTTTPSAVLDILHGNFTDDIVNFKVSGESYARHTVDSSGFSLGPGSGIQDVNVYRSGTGELTMDTDLSVNGDLNVSGNASVADLDISGDLTINNVSGDLEITGGVYASGINGATRAYKAADTTRISTITSTDDPDLIIPVVAGAVYLVRFVGMVGASTAGDVRVQWGVPTSSTGLRFCLGPEAAATSRDTVSMRVGVHQFSTDVAYGISSTSLLSGILEQGVVTTVNAGNISIKWAQQTSSSTGTVLGQSSHLEVIRIG